MIQMWKKERKSVGQLGEHTRQTLLDPTAPGEVAIHRMECHFPALRTVSLRGSRGKEAADEEIFHL